MAAETATEHAPGDPAAAAMIARVRTAAAADERRLATQIDDLFLPGGDRLDDRSRARLEGALRATIDAIDRDVRTRAARSLLSDAEAAGALADAAPAYDRLAAAGLLRDPALIGELVAATRMATLAERLAPSVDLADRPSLLVRLAASTARQVAEAAGALLVAESGQRAAAGVAALPAELHHRVVWWVAAALHEAVAPSAGLDRALIEAARANLAAQDEGSHAEAAAMRLALAIDAREEELPALLGEVIGDRRLGFLAALLAHGAGLPLAEARAIVLDPAGDRLLLLLQALGLPRETMARIAMTLADADPRRDLDALPDALDAATALPREAAEAALEPFRLDPDYRAARRAVAASRARE